MKVLLDTSVLVAAIIESHPMHARAFPWLRRMRKKEADLVVASHTLAELYAVLTGLPVSPRIAPTTAWRLIKENVLSLAEVVSLSPSEYRAALQNLAELGVAGGAVYDALIARAAAKAGVKKVVTLNAEDVRRVAPEMAELVVGP